MRDYFSYLHNLLLKLMCNGPAKKVSAGDAPCNIKGRKSFGNVETGLEMLFTTPQPVSDWLTQRSVTRDFKQPFFGFVMS